MLSFKQILGSQKEGQQSHSYLFTKLKQNILNQSTTQIMAQSVPSDQPSIDKIMKQCELEFQILKLQKANYIANKYIDSAIPFQDLIEQLKNQLDHDIEQIITKKFNQNVENKQNKCLQSTVEKTADEQSKKKQIVKNNLTPKIVQFTLGNREASSAKSNASGNHEKQQVSEFFINSKGVASKSIKQKVMGQRKFK